MFEVKDKKVKNCLGRPAKYDPDATPLLAKWMARSGLTDVEMAKELGVAISTFHAWKKKFPVFSDSLKQSKEFVDNLVEDCLLKRALGYNYEEEKTSSKYEEDGTIKKTRVERIKKMVIPDTTAQIFWLKNRRPDKWREKVEQSGASADSLAETLAKMADRLPG